MHRLHQLFVCFLSLHIQHSSRGIPLIGPNVRHALKNEFPFVVSISLKNSTNSMYQEKGHICGGALITPKLVLTAAHCFKQINSPEEIVVKVNNRDLYESQIYKIKSWITYNKWAKINATTIETSNDIAVAKLTGCVSSRIKPAFLSNISEKELYGKKAVMAGWGVMENNQSPRYLLTAELNVLEAKNCSRNWYDDVKSQIDHETHLFMCTSAEPPINTSCGDSGSPLLVNKNEIIAVHKGTCHREMNETMLSRQNLHTSINYYKEFITDVIEHDTKLCCIYWWTHDKIVSQ